MILDASGRKFRRKFGFEGGLVEYREPKRDVDIHAVGFETYPPPYEVEDASAEKPTSTSAKQRV